MWEQLNRIMQERNLNGHQLSKMAGVNRSFFSDLKSGKVKYLSWPNICKIADALEISIDELREGGRNVQIYLYQLRKEKGITQKELAQKLGISETAYRQKEKGQRAFKSDEMFIIADILEKDIGDIFSDPRPRNVVI